MGEEGRGGLPAGPDSGRLRRLRRELPRPQRRGRQAREEPGEVARGRRRPARVVGRPHSPRRPGMRRGAPRHGGPREGGPGVREALAQGRLAPQRDPVSALRPQARGVEGGVRGGMRGGRGAREAHGGMRGALRALPRPVRLDGGRRSRGKEGRVVRIAVRFARWLFRAVLRFM